MKSVVAIWNPASGSAPVESKLRAALGNDVELVETTRDDPGAGQAAAAVAAGAPVVVACGGDGTVRVCLDPLAGTDTSLGIVPLGTGNLLASNLAVGPGLRAASGVGRGAKRSIDLGRVNNEAFAVMAGSGFDALLIRDAGTALKARIGTAAYAVSAARHLKTDRVPTKVTVDGAVWFDGRTTMVLVANFGKIPGGVEVFPDAKADDGLLDVAVMSASSVREWASIAWRLLRRREQRLDIGQRVQGRHIIVELEEARAYELDGEARDPAARLEFTIEPGAITVHQASDRAPVK